MPEDLHRNARMHVEGCQQRATGLTGTVPGDPWHISLDDTTIEAAVEVVWLDWRATASNEDQSGLNPCISRLLAAAGADPKARAASAERRNPPRVRERGHPPGAAILEAEQDHRQGRL